MTYFKCNLIYVFVTCAALALFRFINLDHYNCLHYCINIISLLITIVYSPVSNPNKPLSERLIKKFRILSITVFMLLEFESSILMVIFSSCYSVLIDITLFIVSIFMFITDPMKGGKKH
jgi:hypothetical protein